MKKVFLSLALVAFVGASTVSTVMAANGVSVEVKEEKEKKKKKKKGCCADKKAEGDKKGCCSKEGEKKSCGEKKTTNM